MLQQIAEKHGIYVSRVHRLSRRYHWKRYQPPLDEEQLCVDIEAMALHAENEAMLHALKEHLKGYWQTKIPKQARLPGIPDSAGKKGKFGRVAVIRSKPAELPPVSVPQPPKVIQFPGTTMVPPPPSDPPVDIFRLRSKQETLKLRSELSQARGAISMRQLQQLQNTQTVVADYEHYFRVYLKPQDFLDQGEMADEVYQDRLSQLRKLALSYLAPTERDTLSGAVKTLMSARTTVIQLERLIAGITAQPGIAGTEKHQVRTDENGEPQPIGDLSEFDLETLRNVKGSMELLLGRQARASEPPKPPAPESLDDLKAPPNDLPEPDLA
jgi:hypothetical protein